MIGISNLTPAALNSYERTSRVVRSRPDNPDVSLRKKVSHQTVF
jgi:hypothetical protein